MPHKFLLLLLAASFETGVPHRESRPCCPLPPKRQLIHFERPLISALGAKMRREPLCAAGRWRCGSSPEFTDVKAKPLSIRHRFILLQALTFALAIWLLAGALHINLKIRREMEEPLRDLHAALALDAEMGAAQQAVLLSRPTPILIPAKPPMRNTGWRPASCRSCWRAT